MKSIVQPLLLCLFLSSGWMLSYAPAQAQLSQDLIPVQAASPTPPSGPAPTGRRRGGASY